MATTDEGGYYSETVPRGSFSTQVKKLGNECEAITQRDVQTVLDAQTGKIQLTSYQLAACDVTADGLCSSLDAARIKQKVEGKINGFDIRDRCGSDWIFYPDVVTSENIIAIEPDVTGGNCETGGIAYNNSEVVMEAQDFKAVLVGDVDGDWNDCIEEPAPTPTHVVASGCQVSYGPYSPPSQIATAFVLAAIIFLFFFMKRPK